MSQPALEIPAQKHAGMTKEVNAGMTKEMHAGLTEIFSRVLITFLTQTTKAVFKTALAINFNGKVEWDLWLKEIVIQLFNAFSNITVVVKP